MGNNDGWLEHLFIKTNGVQLHVVVAGEPDGKPVFLLHGFPDFWFGWHNQIPALIKAGFRVIIPDQRGYNLSDCPPGTSSYKLTDLGKDILGLLDNFGCEKADVVGHDWGAGVAWWLALNFPTRIKHLVILNVPHPSVMLKHLSRSPRQMLKSWYILVFQFPRLADWLLRLNNYSLAERMLRSSGKPSTFPDSDIEEYCRAWENSDGLRAMITWYHALVRFRPIILKNSRVIVPTLMLWGKQDVALSSEMAQESINLCDNGRLLVYEESTHWVQRDEASNVNRELIMFLN